VRESGNSLRVEGLAQESENGLKRRGSRVGVRWKRRRKQPPQAPFSAAFSQVSAYMRFSLIGLQKPGLPLFGRKQVTWLFTQFVLGRSCISLGITLLFRNDPVSGLSRTTLFVIQRGKKYAS